MSVIVKSTKFITAATFVGTTAVIAAYILSAQLPGGHDAVEAVRCMAGFPAEESRCVKSRIKALEDAQRKVEEERQSVQHERDALARQNDKYQHRQDELRKLSERVRDFNLFQTKRIGIGIVTTGVSFASVLKPEVWTDSWCYLRRNHNGLPRQLDFGKRTPGQLVTWLSISDEALNDAGLTRAMLEDAKDACQFPEDKP